MTTPITGVTPILNVSNLQNSFAWFRQLGWAKHWEHGSPPTFGAVISGATEIFLCQGGQGLSSPAEVDAFYRRATELGILAPWPPTDMPWNVRECHIRHPDGHTFRVGARIPEG